MAPAEVATRIKAARTLRGVSQAELARRLQDAGLPWRLAGALERGETTLKRVHCSALADALEVSENWFQAPVEQLVNPGLDK